MQNYLVVAELENKGYIIGFIDDYQTAKAKLDEICSLGNNYPFNLLYFFHSYLNKFQSYPINGNAEYVGNFKFCTSNGILSIYIIDVKEQEQEFSLQQFISERTNTSYALISEETVPEVMFYAN